MLGRGSDGDVEAASSYGKKIGLAFQIADDILDIEGESEKMGKAVGGDRERGKVTYPAVLGMRRSKDIQAELVEEAIDSLRHLDHKADPLREIASYIINRKK
jgi:geranylgeranyl diphosphate synthase type II